MSHVRQALISAGANLGDRRATLLSAERELCAHPGIMSFARSSFYETEPVGVADQPRFLNAAWGVETTLSPEALLAALQAIEHAFGRIRTLRWGPRTLDLDLLVYEGEVRETAELRLPHPRMLERNFVLVPLRELLGRAPFDIPEWTELRAATAASSTEGVLRVAEVGPQAPS